MQSEFVTPLTLQTLVQESGDCQTCTMKNRAGIQGTSRLADNADLLLVALRPRRTSLPSSLTASPTTRSVRSTLATPAPVLIAPAMNGKMWQHPATRENVATLKSRGVEWIGPQEGMLACGYEGIGRLWPVDGIVEAAEEILHREKGQWV